jgi:hypothetical protein
MVYTLMNETLPFVVGAAVITRTIDTTMGKGSRSSGGSRRATKTKTVTKTKKVKTMAVAVAKTRPEAEAKAKKYIKAGHRGIRKQSGVYKGRRYNYVVYVK